MSGTSPTLAGAWRGGCKPPPHSGQLMCVGVTPLLPAACAVSKLRLARPQQRGAAGAARGGARSWQVQGKLLPGGPVSHSAGGVRVGARVCVLAWAAGGTGGWG